MVYDDIFDLCADEQKKRETSEIEGSRYHMGKSLEFNVHDIYCFYKRIERLEDSLMGLGNEKMNILRKETKTKEDWIIILNEAYKNTIEADPSIEDGEEFKLDFIQYILSGMLGKDELTVNYLPSLEIIKLFLEGMYDLVINGERYKNYRNGEIQFHNMRLTEGMLLIERNINFLDHIEIDPIRSIPYLNIKGSSNIKPLKFCSGISESMINTYDDLDIEVKNNMDLLNLIEAIFEVFNNTLK